MDPEATPRFCKARPVPYSLRGKVEEELECLEKEGITEPVQFAEWAAPVVPVLKSDKKSLQLCGDFKQTIYQVGIQARQISHSKNCWWEGLHQIGHVPGVPAVGAGRGVPKFCGDKYPPSFISF